MIRPAFRSLFNIVVLLALLMTPMTLMSTVSAGTSATIEAPTQAKKGLGFVLLVSLQRS